MFIYFSKLNPITAAPSITRTIPVARLSVLGSALLANTAADSAQACALLFRLISRGLSSVVDELPQGEG